jgi:hypothetical protein
MQRASHPLHTPGNAALVPVQVHAPHVVIFAPDEEMRSWKKRKNYFSQDVHLSCKLLKYFASSEIGLWAKKIAVGQTSNRTSCKLRTAKLTSDHY